MIVETNRDVKWICRTLEEMKESIGDHENRIRDLEGFKSKSSPCAMMLPSSSLFLWQKFSLAWHLMRSKSIGISHFPAHYPVIPIFSSSQSNLAAKDCANAPSWQCDPAPYSSENTMSSRSQVR
jgi:hypothetical protein